MGRESLKDDDRRGRPTTATAEEFIAHVRRIVMDDRRLTVNLMANTVVISREQVETILHNELGMSMVSTRWVPRLLKTDQKADQADPVVLLKHPKPVFLLRMNVASTTLSQKPGPEFIKLFSWSNFPC